MDGQPAPTAPPGPPSPGSSNRPSIADRAYFGLRDQIVTLRLPPGTALIEDALMRELEIASSPATSNALDYLVDSTTRVMRILDRLFGSILRHEPGRPARATLDR